jgi:DNA-binding transcriptional MerR regulator
MQELENKTGVGREAIRFYIREGMLPTPNKPTRNVAEYSEEHVRRIRLIKELQEKRFLPLKQVKAVLESSETRSLVASERMPGVELLLPALLDSTPSADKTVAEVAQTTGFTEQEIVQIAEAGVISISAGDMLDFRDAAIVETWAQANAAGFNEERGYGPDFLKMYVTLLKPIAEHEVGLFMDSLGADLSGREAAEIGAKGVNAANQLITMLHTKLVLASLKEGAELRGANAQN